MSAWRNLDGRDALAGLDSWITREQPCWNPCPHCNGEGFVIYDAGWDRNTGAPMEDMVPCAYCNGKGEVEEPVRLVERDDDMEPDMLSGPVSLSTYVGGGKLTIGFFPSVWSARHASEEGPDAWIDQGDGTYRSRDGRSVIEPVST